MDDEHTTNLLSHLAHLVNNSQYQDVILTVDKENKTKDFYALSHILACRSDVFASMFKQPMTESQTRRILIKDTSPESFEKFLHYIYTSRVHLTSENAIEILSLALKFNFPLLQSKCRKFVSENITCDTVLLVLETAMSMSEDLIMKSCLHFVDHHFEEVSKGSCFEKTSQNILLEIIKHNTLEVDELLLFRRLVIWCQVNAGSSSTAHTLFQPFLPFLRLAFINSMILVTEVRETGFIPDEAYIEALEFNIMPSKFQSLLPRLNFRFPKLFIYNPNNHYTGIIHFIATNEDTEPWVNPHITKKVVVSGFPLTTYEGYVEIVNRGQGKFSFGTDNITWQWIQVDLGHYRVFPTHYRLERKGHFQNWEFEGSEEGNNWSCLRVHNNDTKEIGFWEVQNLDKRSFRYFRIRPTGISFGTSFGNFNAFANPNPYPNLSLSCCCLELFGKLKKK